MLLEGMFLPLTTPFTPDGRLNASKLEDNVTRYSKTPAAGLVALSRTGQPTLLSDDETRQALRTVAEATAAEKVLVAGVARDSVTGTLSLIEYAAQAGYDVALVPVPVVLRSGNTLKEILTFYRTTADRAALPIVIDAGDDMISVGIVSELATHPGILGAVFSGSGAGYSAGGAAGQIAELVRLTALVRREVTVTTVFAAVTARMLKKSAAAEALYLSAGTLSSGGVALSVASGPARGLKTRTKTVGFQILCGHTAGMLAALEAGAVGAMPSLAASAPQVCYEVLAAWKDGDPALAAEKQERLLALARYVEEEQGEPGLVAKIKYGCDLNGYFGGRPRLPMLPLTGLERKEIDRLMQSIRN